MAPVCDGGTCKLFGVWGICVQAAIGLWCFLVLVLMWAMETPRRSCMTWFGDMAKQIFGAGWMHFMNVACSMVFSGLEAKSSLTNQCVWYLVIFITDIFLVTLFCWAVTSAVRGPLVQHCGIDIGDYAEGEGPKAEGASGKAGDVSPKVWVTQTAIWIAIVTMVKLFVFALVFLTNDYLYDIIALAFHWLGMCGNQHLQLVVSVVIVPVIGDAMQFAAQDCFLKRRVTDHEYSEAENCVE